MVWFPVRKLLNYQRINSHHIQFIDDFPIEKHVFFPNGPNGSFMTGSNHHSIHLITSLFKAHEITTVYPRKTPERCFMVESLLKVPLSVPVKKKPPKILPGPPSIFWFHSKNRGFPKIIGLPPVKKSGSNIGSLKSPIKGDKWWVPTWLQVVGPPVDRVQLVNITPMSHNYGLWYANNYTYVLGF